MSADLAGPPQEAYPAGELPPGVTLRAWTADLAPASLGACDAAFRERPGFPGWSECDWLAQRTRDESFAPALSKLAVEEAGSPAGFVIVSANWIEQLGVVPRWRYHGPGNALLAAATSGIATTGHETRWLTVATNK